MSLQLISRSSDLKQLQDEGYDLEIKSGLLLVKDVPYVNASKEVKRGILVSKLTLSGDVTAKPDDHVAYFAGDHPCYADGTEIQRIKHQSNRKELAEGVVTNHSFSAKPKPQDCYPDYHAKITTYVAILSGPAKALDPAADARTFPVVAAEPSDANAVFNYIDTASSRAEIGAITKKLEIGGVAIVGLGGTGGYVLDLVAKAPVRQIHLYDGDKFLQHNAFRSPGAPSIGELQTRPNKAAYFQRLYSNMHRGIVAHECFLDETNAEDLRAVDFVFLCLDGGPSKQAILAKLEKFGIPYIDVGMGLHANEGALGGVLRVTTSSSMKHDHVHTRISDSHGLDVNNEYVRNIQVADLNALNAALAVIKWKKLFGFYHDFDAEHHSTYTVDGNHLFNEERACVAMN